MLSAAVVFLFLSTQSPSTCADAQSCRASALEAQSRKDYEAFHDLAWLAYRKGNPNDPELMLLLARAQSLSGRPSDALVMLQRLVQRGVSTDAATSEDFARVRALPRWKELFEGAAAPPTSKTPDTVASPPKPEKPNPTPKPEAAPAPETAAPARSPAPAPGRSKSGPLTFTTILTPTAMAYDAVSKRYVIADRDAHRVAIVDENTGQVSTLAGAQAALGEIGGIAIDPAQGDLWVISSMDNTPKLHRLQLISGRVVSAVPVSGLKSPIVGLTYVRGSGLVAADSSGGLWKIDVRGRADALGALEYAPRTFASDAAGRLYASPGGPRLARFSIDPRPGPREILSLPDDAVVDGGVVVVGDRLHFLSRRNEQYEIRTMSIRR